ncbi:DUF4145 domain-containing protein|uniref:DUF4145 domain-containing protein n=1 Tax=Stenotrophomonas sp. SbOxS2 TaxID=2723885 RepID=UPI0015D3C4E7|nr:DUF4145 domain-containing protein [Stenotrophomonas sp. SbOxS2]NYT99499.1 DUF4145 domain-containing protein [Stenotrophomonas sp. SbOxS2]
MAFKRDLWSGTYDKDHFPSFPCPMCLTGNARLNQESIDVKEPAYSAKNREDADWEPCWDVERFSLKLTCDDPECGEISVVSGDTSLTECFDEEDNRQVFFAHLHPRAMFPAPVLISIPELAPPEVRENIRLASSLYWMDPSSSANRLRASVEFLLDFLEVPRESMQDGKARRLDLNARIAFYGKVNAEHASSLTALRMVGNLGSHGESVRREALLDAFEIYEYTLEELCGQRKSRIEELRQKLISTKGNYNV